MGKIGIPTPMGSLDLEWDKTIKNPETDIKLIRNIIKSYVFALECEEEIDPLEIDELLKKIKAYGHLGKFKDEDKEEYKKLVKKSKNLKKMEEVKKKAILNDLIQEIEHTIYNDRKSVIEKAKRTIAGLFGEESQKYHEYCEVKIQHRALKVEQDMKYWKELVKQDMIAKLQSYIAEIDIS